MFDRSLRVDGLPTTEQLMERVAAVDRDSAQVESERRFAQSFPITSDERWTHLRFKIYPDGGVARLRVYGEVVPHWNRLKQIGGDIDLAAVENGGMVLSCSDMFFGHRHNLIMPGRALEHERWLGNEAPARSGSRLDHHQARHAGPHPPSGSRHVLVQRQLP